jgi:hypothetical protein
VAETLNALSDMRAESPPPETILDSIREDYSINMDWETLPDQLQDNKIFLYAIRDFADTP